MKQTQKNRDILASICQGALTTAEGAYSDDLQANRQEAMKYYRAGPRGDEKANRSAWVSTDVADTVNATLAQMLDTVTLGADVRFRPNGLDDAAQALAESRICKDVIFSDNDGERKIQEAIKDALLMRNGCMKVGVEDITDVQRYNVEGLPPEQVAAVLDRFDDAEQQDEWVIAKVERREFRIDAVPIENISYEPNFAGRFQDLPFFAEHYTARRSDLIAEGYDKARVNDLPAGSVEQQSTNPRNYTADTAVNGQTRDMDKIDVAECYVLVDLDGDDIAERYRVIYAANREVLQYEPADVIPYAMGSAYTNAHRITGESLFDHVKPIQDAATTLTRQFMDNVSINNQSRVVYDPSRVSEEDVLTPQAGGGIRSTDMNAVMPLPVMDMTSGILMALDHFNRKRAEKAGGSLDMTSAEAQLMNTSATAASIDKNNMEMMAGMMSGNIADTLIRQLYLLTHYMLRTFADRPYLVDIQGQTQEMDPRMWPPRNRIQVRSGLSANQRTEQANALTQHLSLQISAMQQGMNGQLANADTLYRTSSAILELKGVGNPELYGIDPTSPQAQQAAQQQAEQQQQQQQMQIQMQQQQQQLIAQLEQAKLAEDARQHDSELEFKYYDTDTDAAVAQAKIEGQGAIDLERQQMANDQARLTQKTTREDDIADNGATQ